MYAGESKGEKFPPAGNDHHQDDIGDTGVKAVPHGPSVYPEYISDMGVFFCPSSTFGDKEEFTECPDGEWCTQNPSSPNFGKLDPEEFNDRSGYLYYAWACENEEVWATLTIAAQGLFVFVADDNSVLDNDISLDAMGGPGTAQSFLDQQTQEYGLGTGVITAQGNSGGNTIYRLREGIERFLITDINNAAASALAQSELAIMWDYLEGGYANASRTERFNHIPGGSNALFADGHVEFLKYPNDKHPATVINGAFGKGW